MGRRRRRGRGLPLGGRPAALSGRPRSSIPHLSTSHPVLPYARRYHATRIMASYSIAHVSIALRAPVSCCTSHAARTAGIRLRAQPYKSSLCC
eukprot:359115-Rhodomonas_salina.1